MSNYSPYDAAADYWKNSRAKSKDKAFVKQNRPHLFIEKPALMYKLPSLVSKKVLALGCGSGEEIDVLESKGATDITGIDISLPLIEHARMSYPKYRFEAMDAEKLSFDNEYFDFVSSSLVLDYFATWDKVLSEVFRVLKKGGTFLFSNIHPVKWSAERMNDKDGKPYATLLGFEQNPKTGDQIIHGDYLNRVELNETWGNKLTVKFYSRSISEMFRYLVAAGFQVIDIYEPKAIEAAKDFDINYYNANQKIPGFIFFECKKP